MENSLLRSLRLDDVLDKFKLYQRYHLTVTVYTCLGLVFEFLTYYNYVFITEKVGHRCVDFHVESTYLNNSNNISKTHDDTTWCRNPAACSEWVYENPDSFMAEFQLACQDWKRTLVGSAHNFGYMVGLLIVGPMSDKYGRKTMVIITGVSAGVLGSAKSLITSYWLYIVLEFVGALMGDVFSPFFMLAIELVTTKSRPTYTATCKIGLGIGGIVLPILSWLFPYWRTLLKVIYVPGLLSIFLIYLLDESPRWLLAKGRKAAAVKIIKNAAKLNKMQIEENLDMILSEEQESGFGTAIRNTFKSRTLLKRFFVCISWWIACTFVNVGLFVNSLSLQGNKYVNFGLSAFMKGLSIVISACIMNKFYRKGPLIFSFVCCAVLCIGQSFIPKNLFWLQITNYMVGMFMSSMCFNITNIFTSELFPTQSRNSMHALCSAFGRSGGIIAPLTPLLVVYWSGLPATLFGAISLIAGLLTLLVPETTDQNLPDTVCQAEKMETEKHSIL